MSLDWEPWISLAIRWLHLTAGIAWIGSSFYFIWLDNHLKPPREAKKGVAGELWSVHGGGFYHKQKYPVAPEQMPEELHWFKWEAYWTWISGFLLLSVLYYYGAEIYLIDRAKWDVSAPVAIAASLGCLVAGWLIYDGLCRSPLGEKPLIFGYAWFALLTFGAWGLGQIFSDRAAYIQIGAIIGTAMAGNVFFVIIPNQRKVVDDLTAGRDPDPRLGKQAKQRSVHNNYMTLPVLFIMVSNHYPMTFGSDYGWVVLAGLGAVGWLVRHFFNLRHVGKVRRELLAGAAGMFLGVIAFSAWVTERAQLDLAGVGRVSYAEAQTIVNAHCIACHAAQPSHEAFDAPPGGVQLTNRAFLNQYASQIYAQAVVSDVMPLGNESGMTEDERAKLGAWLALNSDDVAMPGAE